MHLQVVAEQEAVKADFTANNVIDHYRRHGCAARIVIRLDHEMPGHTHQAVVQRLERRKIRGLQVPFGRSNFRQIVMAVDKRAAMARQMLDHWQRPALSRPLHDLTPKRRNHVRMRRQRAVADDNFVAVNLGHIQHRRTDDIDAQR